MAKSISIEANELLECFRWDEENYDGEHVIEELADVIMYCQVILGILEMDVDEILNDKIESNAKKHSEFRMIIVTFVNGKRSNE